MYFLVGLPRPSKLRSFEVEKEDWNRSRYLNRCCYLLASLLLCLPCYRMWIRTSIGNNKYEHLKYAFIKELDAFIDAEVVIHGIFRDLYVDMIPKDICNVIKEFCGDICPNGNL